MFGRKRRLAQLDRSIEKGKRILDKAKDKGYNVRKFEGELDRVRRYMKKGDLDKAEDILDSTMVKIKEDILKQKERKFTRTSERLEDMLGELEKQGISIDKLKASLEIIDLGEMELNEALNEVKRLEKIASKKMELCKEGLGSLDLVEELVRECGKLGLDLADLNEDIERARSKVKEGAYSAVLEETSRTIPVLEERLAGFKDARGPVEELDGLLDKARTFSLDVSELEGELEKARGHLLKGELEEAKTVSSGAIERAKRMLDRFKETDNFLITAGNAIESAKGWGFNTKPFETKLEEARKALAARDHDGARSLAEDVQKATVQMREVHKETSALINDIKGRLTVLEDRDQGTFKEAEDEFFKGNYERAKGMLSDLKTKYDQMDQEDA